MSLAGAQVERTPLPPAPSGGVHFIAASRHVDLCADLRGRRYLVVAVASPDPGAPAPRRRRRRGGRPRHARRPPPGLQPDAALELTIRDQVFRARALGAAGLAMTLPRLADAPGGLLDATDGITLSAWLAAAKRAPLPRVLDERDRDARVLVPVPVGDLAGASHASESTPPPSGEIDTTRRSLDDVPAPPPPVLSIPRPGLLRQRAHRNEAAPIDAVEPVAVEPAAPPALILTRAPEPPADSDDTPVTGAAHLAPPSEPEPPRPDRAALRSAAALMAAVPPSEPVVEPEPAYEEPDATPPPPPRREAARRALDAAEWRQHALDLDKARGPKPVSVIERLFAVRYMPLVGALSRGETDGTVKSVVDAWRTSFEHSYREAFSALRVTGKRPPMVFDAPDIAARIARLNGARATKLLLVDAMRFDLGEKVGDRLKEKLAGRAVCVERMLLWAALPSTTQTQLGLLARGVEGLRDADPPSEPDPEIVRGRAVGTLRRDRVGSREVMKLDLVEARLRSSGAGYEERIEALADEVAPVLVKYVETLPPRTLVFLFGDHGFRLPSTPDGRATGQATQGGVSPEEVLVPAQAWLVGGVH